MRYEEELMDIGVKHERERIKNIINMLGTHTTHSEQCLPIHKLIRDITNKIDNNE